MALWQWYFYLVPQEEVLKHFDELPAQFEQDESRWDSKPLQSQRDCVLKPRVGVFRLP
jgi:hypothetical protein